MTFLTHSFEPEEQEHELHEALAMPSCPVFATEPVAAVITHSEGDTVGCGARPARLRGATTVGRGGGAC